MVSAFTSGVKWEDKCLCRWPAVSGGNYGYQRILESIKHNPNAKWMSEVFFLFFYLSLFLKWLKLASVFLFKFLSWKSFFSTTHWLIRMRPINRNIRWGHCFKFLGRITCVWLKCLVTLMMVMKEMMVGGGVCLWCVCVCKQNQSFKIYPSSQRYSYPQDFQSWSMYFFFFPFHLNTF